MTIALRRNRASGTSCNVPEATRASGAPGCAVLSGSGPGQDGESIENEKGVRVD